MVSLDGLFDWLELVFSLAGLAVKYPFFVWPVSLNVVLSTDLLRLFSRMITGHRADVFWVDHVELVVLRHLGEAGVAVTRHVAASRLQFVVQFEWIRLSVWFIVHSWSWRRWFQIVTFSYLHWPWFVVFVIVHSFGRHQSITEYDKLFFETAIGLWAIESYFKISLFLENSLVLFGDLGTLDSAPQLILVLPHLLLQSLHWTGTQFVFMFDGLVAAQDCFVLSRQFQSLDQLGVVSRHFMNYFWLTWVHVLWYLLSLHRWVPRLNHDWAVLHHVQVLIMARRLCFNYRVSDWVAFDDFLPNSIDLQFLKYLPADWPVESSPLIILILLWLPLQLDIVVLSLVILVGDSDALGDGEVGLASVIEPVGAALSAC